MFKTNDKYSARTGLINIAHEVLEMHDEIISLRHEIKRLQSIEVKYNNLLNSSIEHNGLMMRSLLDVVLTPGVTQALCCSSKIKEN
jgi:hypothetical protein